MNFLVTGAAGFIGFHLCLRLTKLGYGVTGIDNLNDYYDVNLKESRLKILMENSKFSFFNVDISDRVATSSLFFNTKFNRVIHLAAQAGVRYSIDNPYAYADSNLLGHLNILEGCRHSKVEHLIYASSSSVYGLNRKVPFSVNDSVDHPVSLYAATKKANELMSHSYSHLYQLPTTGLRFFTVYGPWGRPDMALFKFAKAIVNNKTIDVYNNGMMTRDFTYIDDVIESIIRLLDIPPVVNNAWSVEVGAPSTSSAPYKIYNVGNNSPTNLMDYISELEICLNSVAHKNFMPLQPGDVLDTYADTSELFKATGFSPRTSISTGIHNFVDWFIDYYSDEHLM
ncbi:NAD-dependent epimerase [Serratia fonticola]|uniref:NAD-dependent epimerase n=1 Tax=Serratia fonticola TaxID=47917 RepID=UPI000E0F2620|nr:NAD-dependent epimerase [Serratia fonticola]RDL17374.1 UDP-glucuronate 4-epimerase [Serratia fonticola]